MQIQTTGYKPNYRLSDSKVQPDATAQADPTPIAADSVSLGEEKRINWADIKELGSVAAGGALLGGTPVLGAALGLFDLGAGTMFGGEMTLADSWRGATTLALNAAGTVSLFAGFLPGAAIGLGGAAAMGAGSFVADNLHGKTLFTTEPPAEKPQEPKKEFSVARLGNSAVAGVAAAAFTAIPGFGLLVGLNANDAVDRPGMAKGVPPLLVGGTTLARVGGAIASIGTGNPLPYMAAVGLNSAVMGAHSAILSYKEG